MAKYSGDLLVVRWGTLDVSGQARELEVSQQVNEIDVTTYGSTDKEFITGMADRSAKMTILDDDTSNAVRVALGPGSSSSLTWFPLGTASGNPKLQVGTAKITQADKSYPYDDAVSIEVSMRLSGAVAETTASGTGT